MKIDNTWCWGEYQNIGNHIQYLWWYTFVQLYYLVKLNITYNTKFHY